MQTKQESELIHKLKGHIIKSEAFTDDHDHFYGVSWDATQARGNTQKIMKNQKNMLSTQIDLAQILEEINTNLKELKDRQFPNTFQDYPSVLAPYCARKDEISNIKVGSLIAELQYHLGLLSSPGTNAELSSFKEGDTADEARKKSYSLEALKCFLAPDNKEDAVIAICMNQGVKECICQLAVHKDVDAKDQQQCFYLLWSCENRSASERYATHLSRYELDKIEQMLIAQQDLSTQREERLQKKIKTLEKEHQMDRQALKEMREDLSQLLSNQRNRLFTPIMKNKDNLDEKERSSRKRRASSRF